VGHLPNIAVLHHSIFPSFQWGEAPNVSSTCYNNTDLNKKKVGTNGGIKIKRLGIDNARPMGINDAAVCYDRKVLTTFEF